MLIELMVTSSVLIAGIFCLRKLTFGKISMGLRYMLWLLVAARLLFPLSAGTSPFSVMNLLPETAKESSRIFSAEGEESRVVPAAGGMFSQTAESPVWEAVEGQDAGAGQEVSAIREKAEAAAGSLPVEESAAVRERSGFSVTGLLWMLWLLGFLAVGGYMLLAEWRFARYLHKNRRELPAEMIPGLFAGLLSRHGMKVYCVNGLPSPCLAGRHIYIGKSAAAKEQNLMHILAHEYCHALHGDGLWAFLRCLLAAVYWFDPFVWAAAYAARRDSELACDEAAVRLLGEPQRFAYGRTLLSFLGDGAGGREKCPGMPFMSEGGEHSVRERILALTKTGRRKRAFLAVVLAAVVLFCGCAFTGADREDRNAVGGTGMRGADAADRSGQGENAAATDSDVQARQTVIEENNAEFARIQKEYEEVKGQTFVEMLHDRETDDRELMRERKFDVQSYYDWQEGKGGEKPEDGWYLLCREEGGLISLFGLYTETFGFRGLKVRIGEDVTTLDIPWCASYRNESSDNIRILEAAEDGWPRRFMWKLLAEESGQVEKWRLYEGFRYDTGTVDLKSLTEEDCVEWAREYLSFTIDQEAEKVHVICDGDMYLGNIDISAYRDRKPEDVQIVPDTAYFALNGPGWEKQHSDSDQMYPDEVYEGTTVYLSVGLKLNGAEGLWFDGLPVLAVQVVEDENSDTGFRLEYPRIDESYVARALWQGK